MYLVETRDQTIVLRLSPGNILWVRQCLVPSFSPFPFLSPLVSEKSKLPELKFHLSVVVLDHVGPQVVDAVFEA